MMAAVCALAPLVVLTVLVAGAVAVVFAPTDASGRSVWERR